MYESGLVGGDDELGAVVGVEFGHGSVDVGLHGVRADDEVVGDVVVGQSGGDEGEDFPFAVGQSGDASGCGGGVFLVG